MRAKFPSLPGKHSKIAVDNAGLFVATSTKIRTVEVFEINSGNIIGHF
jgi:hypothetical protein